MRALMRVLLVGVPSAVAGLLIAKEISEALNAQIDEITSRTPVPDQTILDWTPTGPSQMDILDQMLDGA